MKTKVELAREYHESMTKMDDEALMSQLNGLLDYLLEDEGFSITSSYVHTLIELQERIQNDQH